MTHPKQKIIAHKIEWHHGLVVGQHVQNLYFREKFGQITELKILEAGRNVFGKFAVQWEDGTKSLEHPEHLGKAKAPEAV